MATHVVVTTNDLAKRLLACASEQFTGRLDVVIKNTRSLQWSLYFRLGSLTWCTSEVHPIRRWYRQLSHHCPQLAIDAIVEGKQPPQYLDYQSIAELVRQGKVLPWQIAAVLKDNITEILFDILQQWEQVRDRSTLQLTYRQIPEDAKDLTLVLIPVEQVCQQAIQAWDAWHQAGLGDRSPNLAPVIRQAEKLQQQTSLAVYRNLSDLVNGDRALRDLAVKLKQNVLLLTQSIMPYIREGSIKLVEVRDFSYSIKPTTATNPPPTTVAPPVTPVKPQPSGSLIACIDDSRLDSMTMNHILTQAGYRCISIQDPVKALPILLEHKPRLIFLDLVMPVANGYEICAQIRRVSVFKDTPVIILTSNDGIVDRVRAKLVGSSGFLAKPIDAEKVLKILQRHISAPMPVQSPTLQPIRE